MSLHALKRWLAGIVVLVASSHAVASFHLWTMNELYSNTDGSVQYLEMTALAGGQQNLLGHVLLTKLNGVNQAYGFPTNLPGNSAGKKMLIATQGFAALNIVTPDYVVPNNFFARPGGIVDFANGADIWQHGALPTDGNLSLNRDGSTAINSPTNFAGQTGRIVAAAPAPLNFQALWWNAPANSESGWGVNITHQGAILFATWFTYDTDGSGMWLVMSEGRSTGTNTYSGALYRTTGPTFSAVPFNSTQVAATQVGTATFTFADANIGTFQYTVNGTTQTKQIMRQVYANPVPTCAQDGSTPSATNFQDLWWKSPAASESGWGVNLTHQGDTIFATWFTYGTGGRGMWLVMSDGRKTGTNTYTGTLYRTTGPAFSASPWNGSQVRVTEAGTGTFTFTDANNGTFAYTVDGVSQAKAITRQVYANPVTVCR